MIQQEHMITVRCRCSHEFAVPEDQAGGTVQCPRCGLLCDVPRPGELTSLEPDGTIRLEDAASKPEPDRLAQLDRAFARRRVDDSGEEIDLRPTLDDLKRVGVAKPSLEEARRLRAPRYDPETGELITPLDIAQLPPRPPPAGEVPLGKPVLSYSTLASAPPTAALIDILPDLLRPANITVMLIVVASYLVARWLGAVLVYIFAMAYVPFAGVLAWIPFIPLGFFLLGHYGNVIDETGREEKDRLPRPLRDLRWSEDIWGSFAAMFGGLILCFWPAVLIAILGRGRWTGAAILGASLGGLIFLPSVWLTLLSSSSFENLRPDRVLKVATACGARYILLPIILLAAAGAHLWAAVMSGVIPLPSFVALPAWLWRLPESAVLSILVGTYLMHLFCWWTGILYRRRHESFGWAWQRFER